MTTQTRTLLWAPRTLPLYARAATAAIPGAGRLPFLPGGGGEIPEVLLSQLGVRVDRGHLARYSSLCGFPADGGQLPATYPHVLAFGLQMTILTGGSFPYPPVGLVHIENRIVTHRAIPMSEPLELEVRTGGALPHPRGVSFDLITEVLISGELVWEERSTMLKRDPRAGKPSDPAQEAAAPEPSTAEAEDPPETWRLASNLGRRYAAASGDRNPIHLHPLAARSLGFGGAIAHGMWTFARSIAALGGLDEGHAAEASFRRPIVLPATVELIRREASGEQEFAVRDAERHTSHLRGRIWANPNGKQER